jgi:glycosyltransferase involved in cell wall biosynthesis
VLTTDAGGSLPRDDHDGEVHVIRVPAWPAHGDYYLAPEVYGIVSKGGWDLVHCQSCHTFVPPMAMLAAWQAGLPYVVTFHSGGHSSRLRKALRPVQWQMLRPLLARAQRLVGVSAFEVEAFRHRLRLPAQQFVVIPNGSHLPQMPAIPEHRDHNRLIVSVGRLERYKGHHRILAALPQIVAREPNVRLRIVGSGPYEATLQRMAHQLGVADYVEIRGISISDRNGMASVLMDASLVLLLSDYESQGIAVMEALALQRPVLVSDTSSLAELARQGLAKAIALKSTPGEVAAAVLEQLQAPLVPPHVNLPTWDACASSLEQVYRSVVTRPLCVS